MMRRTRDIRSPMRDIDARVTVCIRRESTPIAAKHLFPSKAVCRTATGASRAGMGRGDRADGDAYEGSPQRHARAEVPRRVLLPSYQSGRVFNRYASSRALCHGHYTTGLTGEQLSLGTRFNTTIEASFLVHRAPVALSFQNRAHVTPSIPVAASDGSADTNIYADPSLGRLDLRPGDFHPHSDVPLPVLSEDFPLLTERSPRRGEGSVDGPVLLRWEIELPDPLDHDPQVKPCGFPGTLDMGCINQLGLQIAGLMPCLLCPSPIGEGTTVGSPCELAHACGTRAAGLLTQCCCARSMIPRKEGRQETKCIGFITSRKKLQLEAEDCVHAMTITQGVRKAHPAPCNAVVRAHLWAQNGCSDSRLHGRLVSANSGWLPRIAPLALRFSLPMLGRAPLGAIRPRRIPPSAWLRSLRGIRKGSGVR